MVDQEVKSSSVDYTFTDMQMKEGNERAHAAAAPQSAVVQKSMTVLGFFLLVTLVMSAITLGLVAKLNGRIDDVEDGVKALNPVITEIFTDNEQGRNYMTLGENVCVGKKPKHADAAAQDNYFNNVECMVNSTIQTLEQAGANVTAGYQGDFDAGGRTPINQPYWKQGLCPVNVHWHFGAEHLSVGQFDEAGSGPGASHAHHRRLLASAEGPREGFKCHHYDATDAKFTTPYEWKHCIDMQVGATYEVHWPHSAAGACGTPNQYQTPFYDGVFCMDGVISLDPLNTFEKIGVQGQIFTIVNDEAYYYPDLIKGMVVDGAMGTDVAMYTGSTTGTSRDNSVCSRYTPITWQVDRKCHMISASSFDKMCADMKAQRDDMSDDLHPHGARELVDDFIAANNHQSGSLKP